MFIDTRIVESAKVALRALVLAVEETAVAAGAPRGFKWFLLGLFVFIIGCLISGLAGIRYQLPGQPARSRALSKISRMPTLSLQAERYGADLRLSWDLRAEAIVHAEVGVLWIRDGDSRQQELQLDVVQLRTGSVFYTPVTNSVQFRLEVSDAHKLCASEWVLVLATQGAKAPETLAAGRNASRQPLRLAPSSRPGFYAVQVGSFRSRANAERLCAEMEAQYGRSRLVLHKGDPPLWRVLVGSEATIEAAGMLGQRIGAERRPKHAEFGLSTLSVPVPSNETIPATPVSPSKTGTVKLSQQIGAGQWFFVPNAVLASVDQLPGAKMRSMVARTEDVPPDLPPTRQNSPGAKSPVGDFVPEQVVHQVLPEVSRKARDTIQGTVGVQVEVRVDRSGNVLVATLDSPGPSRYFAELALQAARRWKFSPAKIDGRDVSSEWILRFEFVRTETRVFPVCVAKLL
jgi:TonB family protein